MRSGERSPANEKGGGVSNQWEVGRSLQLMRSGERSLANEKGGGSLQPMGSGERSPTRSLQPMGSGKESPTNEKRGEVSS